MHPGLLIFLLQCFNEMRMRVGVGGEQVEWLTSHLNVLFCFSYRKI
jgi:hypothetical protein